MSVNSRLKSHLDPALQIRAGQRSITANLWPLTAHIYHHYYIRKQQYADIIQNKCYWKFLNIHRKTSVLESLSNKVAGLLVCNFILTL